MTAEKYLDQFRKGSLVDRLKKMAKEYGGPQGQSAVSMESSRLKKNILLEAIRDLERNHRGQ